MLNHITRLALVLGLGIVPLAAQSPGAPSGGAGPHKGQMMDRIADQLKLTDVQKTQIQAIRARYADSTKNKIQAVVEAHKAFRDAARNPDTTPAQLKVLYQTKSDKAFELMLDHRSMQSEIRAILTPDQRTEWDKLQAYRQGMKQGRRGMGGRGMGMGF